MNEYMRSTHTLYAFALLFGLTQSFDALAQGYTANQALMKLLLSALVGTAITFGFAWVLLGIRRKQHLATLVTNWILAIGSGLNLLGIGLQVIFNIEAS
ncbi:hypothetical protein [Mesorhizobium sp. NPDC059025]|uniref:hypothetical protein n=1 Tax=unclassified Mesorhizobium TaxID=325217 RepID=UPI0036BEEBEF